jgi:hypothetical protein
MLLAKDEEAKKKFFDPAELEVLRPNPTIKEGEEEVPTSKKSANTRRVELLQYMKNLLTECCKSHADLLLQSRCGSKVLRGVYETYPSKELTDAIVEGCDNEEGDGEVISVFEHPVGHLSVKNLILSDGNSASKDNTVAVGLAQKYKKTMVDDIAASNRGAFVLAALIATDDSGDVKKEVKGQKKEINSRIKESKKMSKPSAGYEALLKAIE